MAGMDIGQAGGFRRLPEVVANAGTSQNNLTKLYRIASTGSAPRNHIIEQQTGMPFIIMQHMQPGMFMHIIMQSQQA
jgi:hypothetical protein